ncbi:hypothetical protein [Bacillus halotolerans]|uniref:hypothetical protein n=1 Tax=Bacillus halotolerans TaxID=260554 RepID=UPI0015E5C9AE|nr:hypothetical protein [Bacillus halotolerans]
MEWQAGYYDQKTNIFLVYVLMNYTSSSLYNEVTITARGGSTWKSRGFQQKAASLITSIGLPNSVRLLMAG